MNPKKSFALYLLLMTLTPIVSFFILAGMTLPSRDEASLSICFISIFLGVGMVYGVHRVQKKFFSEKTEFDEIDQDRSKERYSVGNRSEKRKKKRILDIFSSKNKCDTCGTEMEYKEEMDCDYCPECREYK